MSAQRTILAVLALTLGACAAAAEDDTTSGARRDDHDASSDSIELRTDAPIDFGPAAEDTGVKVEPGSDGGVDSATTADTGGAFDSGTSGFDTSPTFDSGVVGFDSAPPPFDSTVPPFDSGVTTFDTGFSFDSGWTFDSGVGFDSGASFDSSSFFDTGSSFDVGPACPATKPSTGDACTVPTGSGGPCFYSGKCGSPDYCVCSGAPLVFTCYSTGGGCAVDAATPF